MNKDVYLVMRYTPDWQFDRVGVYQTKRGAIKAAKRSSEKFVGYYFDIYHDKKSVPFDDGFIGKIIARVRK